MKRIGQIFLLVCVLTGMLSCKSVKDTPNASALYAQALQALEERSFVIEAYQFFIPKKKGTEIKYSTGSSLLLTDSICKVQYEPTVFPGCPFFHLNLQDPHATCTYHNTRKNGEQEFILKMDGGQEYLRHTYLITLYPGGNECFVRQQTRDGKEELTFKGRVFFREKP